MQAAHAAAPALLPLLPLWPVPQLLPVRGLQFQRDAAGSGYDTVCGVVLMFALWR